MSSQPYAYPLMWPATWPRTPVAARQPARFTSTLSKARDGLLRELRLMGVPAADVVISSGVPLRRDGYPMASTRRLEDPGVAVWFTRGGHEVVVPCDKWTRVEDNLRAIQKTIEALRGLDRWGARELVDAAFQGFAALGPGSGPDGDPWWETLGVDRHATMDAVAAQYRALVRIHHPDVGGDAEQFLAIQAAYRQACDAFPVVTR